MAFQDFLESFAKTQGISPGPNLVADLSEKYAYVVNAREAVRPTIAALEEFMPTDLSGVRVLHIGCGYGGLVVELARRGAMAVGVDTSEPKLDLARINAQGEAEVTFLKSYMWVRSHVDQVREHGPYDLIIAHDLFRRTYDTIKLMKLLKSLATPDALLSYRIMNGYSTQAVLHDPLKKKVGVTLLAPDKIADYVGAGYSFYFHPREYYDALFDYFGFKLERSLVQPSDSSHEHTKKAIERDLSRIREMLNEENFADSNTFTVVRVACREYIEEARADMESLGWQDLYEKYRAAHWEGIRRL